MRAFFFSILVYSLLGAAIPSPALASDSPIQWRAVGFILGNRTTWMARCKRVVSDQLFQLGQGEVRQLRFSDQDNNCLHLLASELTLTIQDLGLQASGDRVLDVRVSRVELQTSARGPADGLVPMPHYERQFEWRKTEHFGRVLSEDRIRMRCRQYVQTIFGVVNPVGLRTLDCRAEEGSSLSFHLVLADSSLWLR